MTNIEFKKIVYVLKQVYPRDNFLKDPEAVKVWFLYLSDIEYSVMAMAVQRHIATKSFPPSIAELRELSTTITGEREKDWSHGWEEVRTAMRKFGIYDSEGALGSMSETTREVVNRMGWKELCLSERQEVDRANFRMIYESHAKEKQEINQLPMKLKEQLTRLNLLEG